MIGDRCYTTSTGLRIGSAHQTKIVYETSADEYRLQSHLLSPKKSAKLRPLFLVIAVPCIAIFCAGLIAKCTTNPAFPL